MKAPDCINSPLSEDHSEVPFIDRLVQRAALDEELASASGGHARVVLLTGEMGIGKSRLWEEWSRPLSLGSVATVLQTRCLAATQGVPLAPLVDLFSNPAFGQERQLVIPGLPAQPLDVLSIFEACVQRLTEIETRPVVIFIDDLHWVDETTLEWLGYAVHRLREYPLLFVAAYQPESVSADVTRLVAGWLREGVARRLALQQLGPNDSRTLVAACGCPSHMAEHVLSLGMGNPYFLIELCKGAGETHESLVAAAGTNPTPAVPTVPVAVPVALTEFVRTRLDCLPDTTRTVAGAAAMLPPTFHFSALWRVSGQGEVETVDALDTLLQVGLLREQGSSYAFSHPLVGVAVRAGLSEARRDLLRHRLAGLPSTVHTYEPRSRAGAVGSGTPSNIDRLPANFEGTGQGTPGSGYSTGHLHFPAPVSPETQTVEHHTGAACQALVEPLSGRELQVLNLLAQGASNADIAGQLVVAPNTVKRHVSNIFEKLGASNRTQAVAQARTFGVLNA